MIKNLLKIVFNICLLTCGLSISYAGQLGDWTTISFLNIARGGNEAVLARNTIIYTLGGFDYPSPIYPVERTTILPNGTLSSWSLESSMMIEKRNAPVGFATDSYLFAIGGSNYYTLPTTVEHAIINPDGSLGAWTTIRTTPANFSYSTLVKYSTYIYIIGGFNNSPNIFRTSINPDGTLGTWTLLSSKLIDGRHGHMSILIDTTIYVLGSSDYISVEKAVVYPNGELSSFTIISYTTAAHLAGTIIYDGQYLNVIGGYNSGNPGYRSERAKINPDGTLGPWEPASMLQQERNVFGDLQTQTGAYVIGGNAGSMLNSVEYAPILPPADVREEEWEFYE